MGFLGLAPILALLCIATIIVFLIYDYWCHDYWRRRDIPYVIPRPIIGHLSELSKGLSPFLLKYQRKLGPIYGMYHYRVPGLVCGDPEMVKNVLARSSNHFMNRKKYLLDNGVLDINVANQRGRHWREIRSLLLSAFSPAKINQMAFLVNSKVDVLLDNIHQKTHDSGYVDCKITFGSYVIDTLCNCVLGLELDSQDMSERPFTVDIKTASSLAVVDTNPDFSFMPNAAILFAGLVPQAHDILAACKFSMFPKLAVRLFHEISRQAVKIRRRNMPVSEPVPHETGKPKFVDVLGLMMDSQNSDEGVPSVRSEEEGVSLDGPTVQGRCSRQDSCHTRNTKQNVKLTDNEIFGQTAVIFLAGYDSSLTLLSLTSLLLARHPDVQEKLIHEIDTLVDPGEPLDYMAVSKLQYLDQVFCESLRIYPPSARTTRECNETFVYRDITVPKGMQIMIPIIAIHHNPDIWPDPGKFIPERFTKEEREKRHPFAWLPFGGGPRICLAIKFSMMITKIPMVRILQNYRLETCPLTNVPLLGLTSFIIPQSEITLRFVPRDDKITFAPK